VLAAARVKVVLPEHTQAEASGMEVAEAFTDPVI
jgi:hypothetical protein